MSDYAKHLNQILWAWADRVHTGQLDGGSRVGRPPVLAPAYEDLNVIVPPDEHLAERIRALIDKKHRHRHFASLKSSQALTQSVFGAIATFNRLDLLAGATAECGRPAFFPDPKSRRIELEHDVTTLGEPRPTSVDVLFTGHGNRVAVECKFTETEFGRCSRPRMPLDHDGHCDGNYRLQRKRHSRCALTEIGIEYWTYLPSLFAWPADRDHEPCPFRDVYQLGRNALTAAVTRDHKVNAASGHALVLYDDRNPAFHAQGDAARQWEASVAASLVPGLLRRLSWQRLLTSLAEAPELGWLVENVGAKYGLFPN